MQPIVVLKPVNLYSFRGVFDRQDSLRSDYLSDREVRYGIVQQASIDSTDSRLCYLTSSEVSELFSYTVTLYPSWQTQSLATFIGVIFPSASLARDLFSAVKL